MPSFTDQRKEDDGKDSSTDKSGSALPSISLPKGGGAIRDIGEKFIANRVTGTASLSVPIFTTPGRSGFFPQLSLSYDSGGGNAPFGLGWSISVPSITRKTEKGLPRYLDSEDSDTLILSGAEDLVATLIPKRDNWVRDVLDKSSEGQDYVVQRYRPRIEGLFALIERWQHKKTGDIHWRLTRRSMSSTAKAWRTFRSASMDRAINGSIWTVKESPAS